MTRPPWYLVPEVLDILSVIRGKELRIVNRQAFYGSNRDDWQDFDDGFVSSLDAWLAKAFDEGGYDCRTRVCDLVAAVTGQRLSGIHFLSDEPELLQLADAVDAALDARVFEERMAA